MDYEKLMIEARKANVRMSEVETGAGFMSEERSHPFVNIRTAMGAIECGIATDDFTTVAEGQALLEMAMTKIVEMTGRKW